MCKTTNLICARFDCWGIFGAQSSRHPLKKVLGRIFSAICNSNFSIFLIRDFDGQVATVNCSSNDDLTNSFILATPTPSDFLIHYSITGRIIILLLAFKHEGIHMCGRNVPITTHPLYSAHELCLTNYLFGLTKMIWKQIWKSFLIKWIDIFLTEGFSNGN